METHPTYSALSGFLSKYARATAGAAYQTYNDLLLAQQWSALEVVDLPACGRCAFRGRRPGVAKDEVVVPCALSESLSMAWLGAAFAGLGGLGEIYLAIAAEDSSVVYYKLTAGIAKPAV
ncbi:tRNA intron endonuclease [Vararia minispora EC-137]|uniref:tRNA intron endonuclease n=1 Tax=Vararia minispora EC-137 TaxID=1314806 RepID=A0ACB8QJT8_9AGAM|nr:tRNA intron endonuclease [Vararia minispora EC-137]